MVLMLEGIGAFAPGLLLAFGFVTGLQHALEADHVAAVATLVSRNRRLSRAALLGSLWGFGHTTMLFLVGLGVLLLGISIPAQMGMLVEFGVGITLVFLGLSVVNAVIRRKNEKGLFSRLFATKHMHPHAHGNKIHTHPHSHDDGEHDHSHRSLIIGMMHGLAGSGALMLAVLSTVDSVTSGLAYIALFGAGSVVGMLGISTLIGVPFVLTAGRLGRTSRYIRIAAALASTGLGLSIMYETGMLLANAN